MTLPPLVKFPVTFATLGWEVISWIENYLCHGPGDIQGDPIKLDLEECAWLAWAYRVWPQEHEFAGRRLIHRAIYCRPKGCRKSEFAGMVCCAEALAPVRFDGWDANGDPVGKPVTYPFIRIMATEEDQSSNVYDNVSYMLAHGEVQNAYAIDIGRSVQTSTRIFLKGPGGGEIVPSTSGDASKDGGKESHVAADETHLMTSNKLRSMYRTVARNTGKRQDAEPWIGEYSTAWQPGENSIIEQVADKYLNMDYEKAVTENGVLFDMKSGEPPKIFNQDASLAKAVRSAYAPYKDSWTDINKICRIIRDSEEPLIEGMRYYINIPIAGSSQWLLPGEIDAVLGDVAPLPGETITVGFDGSETDDHTALFGCRENGDLFTIGYWTPAHDQLGWRDEVNETLAWAFSEFKVVKFYGDPPFWQSEMADWARKYGSPPVVEFWTNIDSKMAVACGALRSAIRRDDAERITIDPDPLRTSEQHRDGKTLVAWHFQNARTRKVKLKLEERAEEAFVVRKERSGSPNKIDSVPSAVLARRARDDAIKNGDFEVKEYARASW